ncbi:MAG: murein transglycosylase [Betaproteobacteria bacterium]|nr:murein transglycosylase [Betaproteobacteria bacterium]
MAKALLLGACVTPPKPSQPPSPAPAVPAQPAAKTETSPSAAYLRVVSFDQLPGWAEDDLTRLWPAFLASCDVMIRRAGWQEVCADAQQLSTVDGAGLRNFFESRFLPHQVRNPDGSVSGTVTGYYEPLLRGSRTRGGLFQTPLYGPPSDLLTVDLGSVYPELKNMRLRGRLSGNKVLPYYTRAELTQSGLVPGAELVWVDSAVDAFFLQVQGSGRVTLEESKETIRMAYADQNGHPYKSIGRYLIDRGELKLEQASMQGIKAWAAANPHRLQELLNANPSFVFFKEEKIIDPGKGPRGALGVPLTAQRSIAIDPQFITLGAPVFLSTTRPNSELPMRQLMVAQDTGGAIRNPVRADFFWGFGDEAGELAGKMKQAGQMWVLLPRALSILP